MTAASLGAAPDFVFAGGRLTVPMANAVSLVTVFPHETLDRYDFARGGGWNTVDVSDIGRLIAMVGFPQAVASALMMEGANAPWHGVPVDARLEDIVPLPAIEAAGVCLYTYFDALPGVGWAVASKLLHLKRPAFFPILDSVVEGVYRPEASILAGGTLYPPVEFYWRTIRNDLIAPGQSAAIAALRNTLAASPDPGVRTRATLTALRLRDILIWMSMSASGAALAGAPPAGPIPLPTSSVGG